MDHTDESSSLTTSEQVERNFHHLVLDIAWFGLAVPATSRFLSVYAIRLDASAMLLGWLAALPAIIALATSGLSGWWRKRHATTVQAVAWPGLGYRMTFLLPAFTPFLPADWQPWWLVLSVSLPAIPQGISSVLFLVLLREGVDNTRLTALMSRRSLVFNVTVGVGTLAFGVWLKQAAFPLNYQVMFLAAFAFSLMSYLNVQRVQALAPEPVIPEPGAAAPVKPWKSPAFQRVAFICVIMHISFFTLAPIIPLHLVDGLGADEGFMSIFAVAELAAAAAMAAFTNRIVRRLGTRPTIAAGMFVTAVSSLILALTPYLPVTLIASALSGAGWTVAAISQFAFFSESTPADSLTPYSTLYNQIVMLSIFIGPMIGSQLASNSIDLTAVLLIGTGLRLIAALLIPLDLFGRPTRQRRAFSVRGLR